MAEGRTAKIALVLAGVSVVVVAFAVIVVIGRGGSSARAASPAGDAAGAPAPGPEIVVVDARDVVRMDRGTVDPVTDSTGAVGIKINDAELLDTLRLEASDVITAISGKPVRRQFDVYDALLGASMMNATTLYVEMVRGGKPVLVKWELEGDLREARTGQVGRMSRLPSTPLAPDPLVDTIKRIDDFTHELPRTTVEQLGDNVKSGILSGLRAVPSIRGGVVDGVKLYAIRPGSVWAALGLKNGDTIMTANGRAVTTSSIADDFEALRGASALELQVTRRSSPVTLKYSITK